MKTPNAPTARVGVFGGTFDPLHKGHLAVAQAARKRFQLDRIYFVPSGLPPHKPHRNLTPYLHRYAMVALACAAEPRFIPSRVEGGRHLTGRSRSYSVDTVRRLRRRFPRARLYFILGADQFLTLRTWKNYRALIRLCDFIVATRPGVRLSASRAARVVAGARTHLLATVHADISSSRIRQLIRSGLALKGRPEGRKRPDWRKQVPPAVAGYIRAVGLYSRER